MKFRLTLVFCAIATLFLHSQTLTFTKGTELDPDGLYKRFIQTSDGGFMQTTFFYDTLLARPFVYMIKYNAGGNFLWSKRFQVSDYADWSTHSCPVIQTSDGGFAIATTYSQLTPARDYACIVKTDAMGNVAWIGWYYGIGIAWANGICETTDHGFAVCGKTRDTIVAPIYGFVFRTDSTGNQTWAWSYDCVASAGEEFLTIQQSFTSDLLIYGVTGKDGLFLRLDSMGTALTALTSSSTARFTDGVETVSGNVVVMGAQYYQHMTSLYELTPAGSTVWSRKYQSGGAFEAASITATPNGYTMLGRPGPASNLGVRMAHIDFSGNTIWANEYSEVNGNLAPCIVYTSDDGYCFAGEFTPNSGQDCSIIVTKTDSTGMGQCTVIPLPDSVGTVATLVQQTFVLTNAMGTANMNVTAAPVMLHEILHCQPMTTDDPQTQDETLSVYPNPASDKLMVETFLFNGNHRRIRICDVSGRTVFDDEMSSGRMEIDLSALSAGMYFVLLEENGAIIAQEPVIRN